MAQDPFPNTSDQTMEMRLAALFTGSNTVLTVPTDPEQPKEGMLWYNTTDRALYLYSGGKEWLVGVATPKL
jgi:hypothetical protein